MSDTREHPADQLGQREFDISARYAADQLQAIGFTYTRLQPGDGTSYDICIIRPPTIGQWDRYVRTSFAEHPEPCKFNDSDDYLVSHSIRGQLYGWAGIPLHHDYVWEKWTSGNERTDRWTARVIARFLTSLSKEIDRLKAEAADG